VVWRVGLVDTIDTYRAISDERPRTQGWPYVLKGTGCREGLCVG